MGIKMNILVTGGAGFIASNIVDAYIKLGHNVVIIDDLSTGLHENINEDAKFYHGNICDVPLLNKIFNKHNIQIVNHHAAKVNVREAVTNPVNDAQTNIMGSLNLIKCSIDNNVKNFIFASSGGAVYGEIGEPAYENEHHPQPISPYGVAKLAVENYLYCYYLSHGFKSIIFRYPNIYGPRQRGDGEAGVNAIFIDKMLKNETITMYGDGSQIRDYTYVKDVVMANVFAVNLKDIFDYDIFNVSTCRPCKLLDLANIIKEKIDYKGEFKFSEQKLGDLAYSCLGNSKIEHNLKFKPITRLEDGLDETIKWHKERLGIK